MTLTPNAGTGLTNTQRAHAVLAGYLGWTMDAFDFFVVVFMISTLADSFHVSKARLVFTMTMTLAMRPVGAFLFGLLADRFGRRVPLMCNVIYFSLIEVLCGFAKDYNTFLLLRALYGIGMGGEWGIGASLAMESIPQRWRGLISGALQSGYSAGYLLAALAYRFVFPSLGWRWMFWIGGIPAILALYIRWHVPESEAWKEHAANSIGAIMKTFAGYWKSFAYLCVMMTLFMFLSHGTQDLYPDFLKTEHHLNPAWVSYIAIIYNIGAIVGAIIFGLISQHVGRRKGILFALFVSMVIIPAWAFSHSLALIAAGAFIMQVGVQGAWGVVPVHLNELAPDAARGLVPGFAYQLGILFASPTNSIEYALRDHFGYRWALAGFEIATIVGLAIVVWFGQEAHGKQFTRAGLEG